MVTESEWLRVKPASQQEIAEAKAMALRTLAIGDMINNWAAAASPSLQRAKSALSPDLARKLHRAGADPAKRLESLR